MKKIVIIAVAALAVSFASCKKAKTCTCTSTSSSGNTTYTDIYKFDKVSAGDANAACPKTRVSSSTSGGITYSSTETCVLS